MFGRRGWGVSKSRTYSYFEFAIVDLGGGGAGGL